jgi:hypothetical protein
MDPTLENQFYPLLFNSSATLAVQDMNTDEEFKILDTTGPTQAILSDMDAEGGWINILCDESQSPDTLPPSYEDALEGSRNDMDVTLHPGVDTCMLDSSDENQTLCKSPPQEMMASMDTLLMRENTDFITGGMDAYHSSMDGMPLSADREDVFINFENSFTSQPAGMTTSTNTSLTSQNTYCIEGGVDASQFSMDGMPLKPWIVDLECVGIGLEKSLTSQSAGTLSSTNPLLMLHPNCGILTDQFSMDGTLLQPWNMCLDAHI